MKVLSLFDGISCGQVALERAGIKVDTYYASEIDKYAIQVTQKNYPNTIQLGDVTKIDGKKFRGIDLLIGGSPCQGFSFAGKQLNFVDPRSRLFFEFVRILEEAKPKYFLLENVKMKKEHQDVISRYLGVEPIEINSALVSAQNRKRLYWTNMPGIGIPEDKGVLLRDVIESGTVDRDKSLCITHRYAGYAGSQSYLRRRYFGKSMGQAVFENCTPELQREHWQKDNRKEWENIGKIRSLTVKECELLQTLPVGYVGDTLTEANAKSAIGNGWTVDVIAHIFKNIGKATNCAACTDGNPDACSLDCMGLAVNT